MEDEDGSTIQDSPKRDPRLWLCAHCLRHRRLGDRRQSRDRARHRAAFVLCGAEPRGRPRSRLGRDRRPERRRQGRSRDCEPSRQQRLGLPQPRRRQLPGSTRLRHLCRTDVARGRRRERRPEAGPRDLEPRGHGLRAPERRRWHLRSEARLPDGTEPVLGRDRRPERRPQPGPRGRDPRRRRQPLRRRLRVDEHRCGRLRGRTHVSDRSRSCCCRDRRPERRRQRRPRDREHLRGHPLRAAQQRRRSLRAQA